MPNVSHPNAAAEKPKPIPKVRTWFWRSFPKISDDIQRGFEQHGDLIQLQGFGARVYCLRNPEHIECVFKDPKVGTRKLPAVFPRLKSMMPHSTVVVVGGDEWRRCQDVMKNMFDNEYMRRYSGITAELTGEMLDGRWGQLAKDGATFDIYNELLLLMTRIACRILFSKELSEDKIVDINDKSFFLESQFSKRLPPVLPTPSDVRYRAYMRELRQFMLAMLHERRAASTRQLDLLQILVDTGETFPDDWIVDHMIEIWNSIRLVNPPLSLLLQLIATYSEVQGRLIGEIRENVDVHAPGFEDCQGLVYLNMVLSEALRFYPSQLLLPRWCQAGMTIGEYHIPPKSLVVPMILHTHRHPKVYAQPFEFNPERWSPENERQIHPYARLAFGAGQRKCLGVRLAKDIIRTTTTSILQRYRLTTIEHVKLTPDNIELTIHPTAPVKMEIEGHQPVPRAERSVHVGSQNAEKSPAGV